MKGLVILLAGAALVVGVAGGKAQFPGRNGLIVFSSDADSLGSGEIFSVGASGKGRADLSRDSAADLDATWSPDGSHIAYSRDGTLIVMLTDGTEQRELGPGVQPAWSPDSRRVAFVRDGAIWTSSPDRADATQLAPGPNDHSPAWSPDGRSVAFGRDPNLLEVVPASGGSVHELARGLNLGARPFAWSRDGRSIYYASIYVLYRVAADASTDRVLLRARSSVGDLALSPNGKQLAFSVDPYSPQTRSAGLWLLTLAGNHVRRLTNSGQERDELPTWSPDGRQIAFARSNDVHIRLLTVQGGRVRMLRREHPGTVFQSLSWSPDGTKLVFASTFDADVHLYTVGVEIGPLRRLTHGWSKNVDPAWSPDGTRIAFASDRNGQYDIYTMHADGSGLRRLTRDPADDRQPAWSPDGSKIVFSSERLTGGRERRAKKAGYQIAHLFVMRADGSRVRKLTSGITYDEMPSWSPGGSRIVFVLGSSDPPLLESIRPDGTRRVPLGGQTGVDPDWAPDGKLLVFLHVYYPDGSALRGPASRSSPPPQQELALMRPDGTLVASLGDHPAARWSPDGSLLVSGDGSILDPSGSVVTDLPAGQASWQPLRTAR